MGDLVMNKLVSVVFLVGILAGSLAAQNPDTPKSAGGAATTQAAGDATRIRVRVDLVNVLFTVSDRKNRLALNLTKDDLHVLEDNKPQSIRFFSRESDLPLRIAILIDTSNSIRERLRFEQEAAVDFLTAALRPRKDQAFVVAFDVQPELLQDYTDDMEKLSRAIRSLQAGGSTGLYDTMYYASKEKMLFFPPPEPYLRRVMIVISDGQDNSSEHTRDEALAMAQRGEVTIFTISTNRSGIQEKGDRVLKYLAEETGGRAFFPFSAGDLAANFQEIARELRSQYSMAYVSTNAVRDGTYRTITIQSRDKGMRVRAKSGYFAPSQ
jgi:VWFA-related protein